jgi:hypothetical protein
MKTASFIDRLPVVATALWAVFGLRRSDNPNGPQGRGYNQNPTQDL